MGKQSCTWGRALGVGLALFLVPSAASAWHIAIEQNPMITTCGKVTNIPVAGAKDCPGAIIAASNLAKSPAMLSCLCSAGAGSCKTPTLALGAATCKIDPYVRPNGSKAVRYQVDVAITCKSCVMPPTACPAGKPKVGTFTSPGSQDCASKWGIGTYAACSDGGKPLVWYRDPSCHQAEPCGGFGLNCSGCALQCDNYVGYSSVVGFGGKSYCVYARQVTATQSYYNAREEIIITTPCGCPKGTTEQAMLGAKYCCSAPDAANKVCCTKL